MNHDGADYTRERGILTSFAEHGWGRETDVASLQSAFEAEMEARARRGRHAPYLVRSEANGHILWRDNGIRCGTIYVGAGDQYRAEAPGLDDRDIHRVEGDKTVEAALSGADALRPGNWRWLMLPSEILRWRFREVVPACFYTFGVDGGFARRARPLMRRNRLEPIRGCGNLVLASPAAQEAWERAWELRRTSRTFVAWLKHLGWKLGDVDRNGDRKKPTATEEDRRVARLIRADCTEAEPDALALFRKGWRSQVRIPPRVRVAALARCA